MEDMNIPIMDIPPGEAPLGWRRTHIRPRYQALPRLPGRAYRNPKDPFADCWDDAKSDPWSWPAEKFGMKVNDLFGELHDDFNTYSAPMLQWSTFHMGVCDAANRASTKEEFHRIEAERQDRRVFEFTHAFNYIGDALWDTDRNTRLHQEYATWNKATEFFRQKSLESLISYMVTLIGKNGSAPNGRWMPCPSTPKPEEHQNTEDQECNSNSSSATTPDTSSSCEAHVALDQITPDTTFNEEKDTPSTSATDPNNDSNDSKPSNPSTGRRQRAANPVGGSEPRYNLRSASRRLVEHSGSEQKKNRSPKRRVDQNEESHEEPRAARHKRQRCC